jgi:hypothetical protein
MIISYELGDEPSGSIKVRALATSLMIVSFIIEAVMHGINFVINYEASRVSNAQNDVFGLLGNV